MRLTLFSVLRNQDSGRTKRSAVYHIQARIDVANFSETGAKMAPIDSHESKVTYYGSARVRSSIFSFIWRIRWSLRHRENAVRNVQTILDVPNFFRKFGKGPPIDSQGHEAIFHGSAAFIYPTIFLYKRLYENPSVRPLGGASVAAARRCPPATRNKTLCLFAPKLFAKT